MKWSMITNKRLTQYMRHMPVKALVSDRAQMKIIDKISIRPRKMRGVLRGSLFFRHSGKIR